MAHKNKEEIKAYYETNFTPIEEVAKLFSIPKRTLYEWINKEGWELGKHIPKHPISADELLKDEFGSRITKAKENMESEIKNSLLSEGISEIIATATAKRTSDTLLFQAMSVEFLDSKATEALLVAKNAFERFAATHMHQSNAQQKIVSMSKNMVEMYSQLKSAIYGKNPEISVQIANINTIKEDEFKTLSDKELLEIIAKETNNEQE